MCGFKFSAVSHDKAMLEDAECLHRYAETRDQSAFSDFVHRNLRLVYSAAFRQTSRDVHLAEDVTQIVFTTAAQQAKALARHPVISAWLHQTTRNAAIDALRSRQRRLHREETASAMTEVNTEPDNPPDWDKIGPELDKVVDSLRQEDRDAIILRFFGEKSFADIGRQLQLNENAARMRVERALEKMRVALSRKGIVSSVTALSVIMADKAAIAAPAGLGTASVAAALSAPAATGVISVLGILKIMSITKITAGLATVVALVSLATAVHEYRAARSAEQALNDFKATQLAKHTATAQSNPATESTSSQAEPQKSTTPTIAAAPTKAQPENPFAAVMALLTNPAIQAQSSLQTKIRLDTQYASLFKKLNLPPEQLEQFKNLVVEKQMVAFDSITAANEQGINPFSNPQGFFQVVGAAEKNVDNQIGALLGESGFKQFNEYQATVPARNTVTILSQALSFTSAPLTDLQSEQVVRALTDHGTLAMPPNNPFFVLNSDLGVIKLSDEGRAQIQGVLSPSQLHVLDEKIQQQAQLLEVRSRIARPQK